MVSAAPRGRPVPLVPATAEATLPLLAAICMTCNGEDYRGFVDHTESGTECQRWDLQHPHKHPYHPDKYRPGGAQPRCWHGACHPHPLLPVSRPGTPRRVWMTTTAATRMAPSSPGATPLTPRGSASTAASASAVSPRWWHLQGQVSSLPPSPRCSLATQAEKRPRPLNVTTNCFRGKGEGYRGRVNVTVSGIPCQRWDAQAPHRHHFVPEKYPCK